LNFFALNFGLLDLGFVELEILTCYSI
jgi:hypothetical protein